MKCNLALAGSLVLPMALCGRAPAAAQATSTQAASTRTAEKAPAAADTETGAADIVVTATRRPLHERAVPASLAVLSAEALEARSIHSFEALARVDPSLQLSAYQGEMQIFVRGVGAVTFLGGFESSVAVNLDGINLGRPTAVAPAMFDVERVEILKGPQGTLYGRNATGGAINITTRTPSRDWAADARLSVGNYGRVDGFAAISGPLADNVAFRIAAGSSNHDGYSRIYLGRASGGGQVFGAAEDQHDVTVRARFDWTLNSTVKVELGGDYHRADDRGVVFHFAGPGYANNPLFLSRVAEGEIGGYATRTINSSFLPYNKPENWGVSAKLIADLGGAVLTATTGYRHTAPRNLDDLSNSTILAESQFKSENARQFSEEVVLRSPASSRFSYLVGAGYYRERNRIRNEFFFPYLATYLGGAGAPDCCLLRANGVLDTDAYAVFAEAGYALASGTTVTIGARFGHERRWGENLLDFTGLQTINRSALAPATFDSFTPKVLLEQDLGTLGRAYASITKGYKAGGFNVGSTQNTPYSPESIWSYEIGAKLVPAPGWALDASAFHYEYTNLQVQDVDQNTVLIRNAASAKVDGIEIGTRWHASDRLRLEVMTAYLHARFASYETVNTKTPQAGILDLSGNPLPQSPRWKLAANAEYDVPLGPWGKVRLRGDAGWQDRIYFSAFRDSRATQAAYWWLKARMTVLPAKGGYQVALFVDNLTDTRAFTNISITGDLDASRALGNLAPPRTWGAELRFNF